MFGSHLIKSWSSTQAAIALSSGEAEYYSLVKGSSIALGMKALLIELGVRQTNSFRIQLRIKTDASAAKGIASRRGLGKVRHIEVSQLWVQSKVQSGEIEIEKVKTNANLADAMTKSVESEILMRHISLTNQENCGGRHSLMPFNN